MAPFLLAKDCSRAGFSVDEQLLGILRFACGHVAGAMCHRAGFLCWRCCYHSRRLAA